jgi:putative oxidoreductase
MNKLETWFKKNSAWGPLLLRLMVGIIFIVHGYAKLTSIGLTAVFFGYAGIPLPNAMAWLVGIVELLGGIALVLGAFTKHAAVLLSIVMIVAIITYHYPKGFGSMEYPLALLFANLALLFTGPGKWALWKK